MSVSGRQIEIRDRRSRQMFRVDDEYIDGGYSEICGSVASCVYMSLCRHSDSNQESYPSLERIMKQHGIKSKHTVLKAIRSLEKMDIIGVKRKKDPKTKRQMVNVYVLIDKSEWKKPGVNNAPGSECIKNTDPGAFNAQKPGAPNALEGNTEEKVTQRRVVADATDLPLICKFEGCKKEPIKEKEFCRIHHPMDCAAFVAWYRKSKSRYITIIAEFADEVKPEFETVAQWEGWAQQHYKPAIKLELFNDDQIAEAYAKVKASTYITEYNLNTIIKFLINTSKK